MRKAPVSCARRGVYGCGPISIWGTQVHAFGLLSASRPVKRCGERRPPNVERWPIVRSSATSSCLPVVIVTLVFFAVAIIMDEGDVLGTDALLDDDDEVAVAAHLVAQLAHRRRRRRRARPPRWPRYFGSVAGRRPRSFFSFVRDYFGVNGRSLVLGKGEFVRVPRRALVRVYSDLKNHPFFIQRTLVNGQLPSHPPQKEVPAWQGITYGEAAV